MIKEYLVYEKEGDELIFYDKREGDLELTFIARAGEEAADLSLEREEDLRIRLNKEELKELVEKINKFIESKKPEIRKIPA